jgi:hypothetical protein
MSLRYGVLGSRRSVTNSQSFIGMATLLAIVDFVNLYLQDFCVT